MAGLDLLSLLQRHRHDPTRLVQILRDVQEANSWISPALITQLAGHLGVPRARVEGVSGFYAFFCTTPQGEYRVLFSDCLADQFRGCRALAARLAEALHTAVGALHAGDCDLALAGGICVMGSPGYFVEFSRQHALSDDGHCRPYSAHASGTVWAEGAAMFLLQRKSRARRDGRRVLGEIRASRVNCDGRSVGLTAPSGDAQARLFGAAMAAAGIEPQDVGLIEGHGTGTRLGDRTELTALAGTYGATAPGCGALLGSVKSNIGHTQAAAGALGLAKVLIAAGRHRLRRSSSNSPPRSATAAACTRTRWQYFCGDRPNAAEKLRLSTAPVRPGAPAPWFALVTMYRVSR